MTGEPSVARSAPKPDNAGMMAPQKLSILQAAALLLATVACSGSSTTLFADDTRPIVLDGEFDEWSEDVEATADGHYLYVRMRVPDERTLQGGGATTRLLLDLDGDSATGQKVKVNGAPALGMDLDIVFSPQKDGRRVSGMAITTFGKKGESGTVDHKALDFTFAPTYAAREFEVRLARRAELAEPMHTAWRDAQTVRGVVRAQPERGGKQRDVSVFTLELPPLGDAASRTSADLELPPTAAGSIRVVSWNVEHESPNNNPAPFGRILTALDPDIVLLQEWKGSVADFETWFSTHVPSPEPWRAVTFPDLGVAVVARHPTFPVTEERVMPHAKVNGRARPVRFVAARVTTPMGDVIASTLHLKCCGTKGSWEDQVRTVEAGSINRFLRKAVSKWPEASVVIAGDMNLVGTRPPLDTLREDLDTDGSDLDVLEPLVLGDNSTYTWTKPGRFSTGRLDFAVVSDAATEVEQTFTFDTARLPQRALENAHLRQFDSVCSDHRPMVMDLRPKHTEDETSASEPVPINAQQLLDLVASADGRAVMVNFWATWCKPCVQELPGLLRVHRELHGDGLRLLLVTCDFMDQQEDAARLLVRLGVDFPTYIKDEKDDPFINAIEPEWSGALPATLVYDAQGRKLAFHEGSASYDEFAELARQALAKPSGE